MTEEEAKKILSSVKFEDDGYFSKHKPFDDVDGELDRYPLITTKHMDLEFKGFKYKMSKNGILTFKACSLTHNRIVSRCGSDTWVFPELSFNTKHLNPEKAYNIYAICSKETNSGTWYLEEDYLKDFSETDYNFKIGVLYYEQDGSRDVEFSTNIFPFTSIRFDDGKIIMTTGSLVYKEEEDNPVVDWSSEVNKKMEKENYRLGCPHDQPLNTITVDELSDLFLSLMTEKLELDLDKLNTILDEPTTPHTHYDNKNGSLYKIASDLNLNAYEFDILKRIARCRKKGQFKEDLQKIKDTVDLYLKEHKQ